MIARVKEVEIANDFKGCNPNHKKELFKIVFDYDGLFQEPRGFPPKHEIQHDIHLQ